MTDRSTAASTAAPIAAPSARDAFSLAEARAIVGDLFQPCPWRYWTDFLTSIFAGHACYFLTRTLITHEVPAISSGHAQLDLALALLAFVLGGCLYYRAAMFIHELVHLRAGTFTAFRVTWNLLCGIPFFMPSFVYHSHLAHHRRRDYGTDHDGEYLPLGRGSKEIVLYLLQIFAAPVLVYLRFLVLTPLAWLHPRLRAFVDERCSSMVMNPAYLRPLPTSQALFLMRLQEALVFLVALAAAIIAPVFLGRWPIPFFVQAYATALFVLALNHIRTLGGHRWTNLDQTEMTFVEQLLDSVNYPRATWTNQIWGPVGLRFHALHHLFPSLPYHAMPEAHRRLMAELPANSPYRQTNASSLRATLRALLESVRRRDGQSVVRRPFQVVEGSAAALVSLKKHRRPGKAIVRQI